MRQINRSRIVLIFIWLLVLFFGSEIRVFALGEFKAIDEYVSEKIDNKPYVPGEVIVKFKKDRINLSSTFSLSSGLRKLIFDWTNNFKTEETLKKGNILVLKVKEGQQIDEVINILKDDPNVEFAEPNYYKKPMALSINDTYKANLWGLENTGQNIVKDSGASLVGTLGADMDIRRAWALSMGTTEVIVAVIDDGVAYDHPDLIDNMWDGSSCKDENGGALGGCLHGYDYENNDLNPSPSGSGTHGTHVAGTIAGKRDNSKGIAGVGPNIKIMALKFGFDTISEIKAIDFAIQNGAKVINASFGGPNYALSEKQAIERFLTAGGIFVTAAGNETTNNDTEGHSYPSDYDSGNIISVAATDQNDELATFSNFGTTSVDVAAPGTFILSTVSYRKDLIQNFYSPTHLTPDASSYWGILVFPSGVKGLIGDTNAMVTTYKNNSDYYIKADSVDLSAISGLPTEVNFTAVCNDLGTTLGGDAAGDYMTLEVSGDGSTFTEIYRWNEAKLSSLTEGGCSGGNCFAPVSVSIGNTYLTSNFAYRFHWVTDSSLNTDTGCYVYDMKIVDFPIYGVNGGYDYKQGTSMAVPHVAGLAGYLWSIKPSASMSEIIANILNNGDTLPALIGKTVTGRRINAYNSVLSLGITALTGPSVTGLADDAVPAKSKYFTWSSATPASDQYRFSIDQLISGVPSSAYGVGNSTTYSSGSGTFYIHVQARDADLVEGPVATVSFILDNMGPSPTVSTSSLNSFVLSFGETLYTNLGTTLGTGVNLLSRFVTNSGIGMSVVVTTGFENITIGVSGIPLAGNYVNLLSGTVANNFYDYLTNMGSSLAVFYDGDAWEANPSNLNVATSHFPDLITTGLMLVGGSAPATATSLTANDNLTITIGGTGANSSVGLTQGTIITELNDAVFNANLISGTQVDVSTISGLEVGYAAQRAIQWGIVGSTLKFSQPVIVNIYLGSAFNAQILYVYRSESLSVGWTSSGLSSPTCVVSGGFCSFATAQASYFLAAFSSAPTLTPGPTSVPSNNNNSQSPGNNDGPRCNDRIPLFAPDLFRITTTKGSAKIIYTPVNEKITGYAVMYGHKKGDERYAAMISPINNNEGEQSFTINKLNPKLTYYFKVTAFNGCVSGPWSDWIPAKADRKREIHKYKTVIKNKVRTLVNKFL